MVSYKLVHREGAGRPAGMPASGRRDEGEAPASLETRLLLGALAGLVGTAAMTVAMRALHRRLPADERYPLPPREIVQEVLPGHAEIDMSEDHRQSLTMAAHFGYGAATGALYAAARPPGNPGLGALYGVFIWGVSYLGWIPAARILSPATQHPSRRNGLMIACHLVWGATMAATLSELHRANAEIFAGDDARDAAPPGAVAAGLYRTPVRSPSPSPKAPHPM
jgi:uncharacterized membrane protein YagU involved in acid resistance